MQRNSDTPAVEREYEGPPPNDQRIWNGSIAGIVVLLAIIFAVVLVAIVFI